MCIESPGELLQNEIMVPNSRDSNRKVEEEVLRQVPYYSGGWLYKDVGTFDGALGQVDNSKAALKPLSPTFNLSGTL